LKGDGIPEKHIYVIAKSGTPLEGLPDGGSDDGDFLPAFERGVAFGGVTGVFVGLVALMFPPSGLVLAGGGVLFLGLAGASVGGLMAGIAGAAIPNSRLKTFQHDIDNGKVLVMVDVPVDRLEHVNALIKNFDPEVEIEGIEPPAHLIPT